MFWRFAVLSGGLLVLCTASVCAQEPILDEMYGSGVHAYFSQDYQQAYDHLTSAVDAGSRDPRCYYFRGLCFLALGREDEANMDFEQAAGLEAKDVSRFYNVGRALERVQGYTRLKVEKYRAEARLEAMKRAKEIQRQRYGELREAEGRVLERQAQPGPAGVADPLGLGPTEQSPVGPDTAPAPKPTAKVQPPVKAPVVSPPAKPEIKAAAPAPTVKPETKAAAPTPPSKPEAKKVQPPPSKSGPKENPFVEDPKQ
jgi:tetratricopeptide (TPR) repeat protein